MPREWGETLVESRYTAPFGEGKICMVRPDGYVVRPAGLCSLRGYLHCAARL